MYTKRIEMCSKFACGTRFKIILQQLQLVRSKLAIIPPNISVKCICVAVHKYPALQLMQAEIRAKVLPMKFRGLKFHG